MVIRRSIRTCAAIGSSAGRAASNASLDAAAVASVWGLASMGSGFGGMLFMALSGWLIARVGYVPVFIGYGLMPVIALALVLFGLGPLRRDPRFATAAD